MQYILFMFWMLGVVSFGQTIQHSEGIVEIRSSPEDAWRPVRVGDSLEARGSLRTFQGDVTLEAMEYTIRLSNDSELWRGLTAFELIQGKSYIEAQAVKFHMGGPVKIEGKARLDASSADGQRLAVLSGKASATISAGVTHLESGQQALLLNGELSVSNYFERDPWYRNLSVLAEGRAAVVGMMGHAEIQNAQGWKLAEVDDIVEPGYNARTALDSWLELRFEDGSLLRLQSDTEIALSQSETFNDNTKRTLVTLQKGKLWAVIEDGQPFEIETPGLVAGVRGTKFRVDAADDNQDALLKTFEGVVAGIIGFEVIDVENGKQFEPQAGLAELQKDALDEFNLLRDKAISAPNLELDFPVFTDQGSILIQGQTDPGSIVSSNGRLIDATQGSLQIEQPLVPGFNLVEIRASLIEDGKEATIIKPIIRTGQEFTFALREPIIQNNQAIISGFVTPGSTIILKSPEVSSQLRSSGYFQISIPLVEGENTIVLEALSPTSQRQSQTFMLEP